MVNLYYFPGETIVFLNLTDLTGSEGSISSATHNKSEVVRLASVANKFKVITVLLYADHNQTAVYFQLKGHTGNDSNSFNVRTFQGLGLLLQQFLVWGVEGELF